MNLQCLPFFPYVGLTPWSTCPSLIDDSMIPLTPSLFAFKLIKILFYFGCARGIQKFPSQGSNPCHSRQCQILNRLCHQGTPKKIFFKSYEIMKYVVDPQNAFCGLGWHMRYVSLVITWWHIPRHLFSKTGERSFIADAWIILWLCNAWVNCRNRFKQGGD